MSFSLIFNRLLQLIPTAVIVSAIVFLTTAYLPGDPTLAILGESASAEQIQALRSQLGLDDPLVTRYLNWVLDYMNGNFGRSYRTGEPISSMLLERLPVTIELTLGAILLAALFGMPLGIIAAKFRNTWVDSLASMIGLVSLAIPYFWFGVLLIILFSVQLRWLPPSGYVPFFSDPLENLRLMILPVACVGFSVAGVILRQTRGAMISSLSQDYVRTSRAKGCSEGRSVLLHALPNALNPVITVIGLQVGALLGGAVISETIFSLPGLGKMLVDGIINRDFPVIQASVLLVVFFVVAINLVVDIIYTLIDPRVVNN